MPYIDDEGTDGSSFVWTIQNFSYCLHKPKEYLDSPSFILDTNETDGWRLRLYPRGVYSANFSDFEAIGFRLYRGKDSTSSRKEVEFVLSIKTIRGSFKRVENSQHEFSRDLAFGVPDFLKVEELLGEGSDTYLDNDTMTLRCRIRKVGNNVLPPRQIYMRTIINVERTTNLWSLEKFRENMTSADLTPKLPILFEMQSLIAMKLRLCREIAFSESTIELEIKQINKDKPCFFTCDLSLLKTDGKVVHSIRKEHRFDESKVSQVWTLPYIPLNKICDYENTYLRCELAVSSGKEYSWMETVVIGETDIIQQKHPHLEKEQDFADSMEDDLRHLYSDGMFTDATLLTPSKAFPVHQAILCARSTVFQAMFERDMKENRTGVVDIEDIDADTVHKMLLFVYSDVVEDLDYDMASKLYFAADKYRITALRRRCSDFLKKNLNVSNVCEVSVLANMHQDEDLKSFAQDFIVENAPEVMRSVEWKSFMQDHLQLASETMHVLLLRKSNV